MIAPTLYAVSDGGHLRDSSMARPSQRTSSDGGIACHRGCLGQVPQESDVADRPHFCERHAVVQVVGEGAGADEAGSVGLADEERRDREVDLVGEAGGEELGVDGAAALRPGACRCRVRRGRRAGGAGRAILRCRPPRRGRRGTRGPSRRRCRGSRRPSRRRGARTSAPGSRSPLPVTVTLSGYSGSPRATRAARRSSELTSSRGLSRRMVEAPMRMASLAARTASTRSKSSALESRRRSPLVSSM